MQLHQALQETMSYLNIISMNSTTFKIDGKDNKYLLGYIDALETDFSVEWPKKLYIMRWQYMLISKAYNILFYDTIFW